MMQKNKKEKHITLKEAAKISNYSPDYIGQLIRQGKIPGKQIYTAVSWVTTEDAVMDYVEKAKRAKRGDISKTESIFDSIQQKKRKIMLEDRFAKFARGALYFSISLLIVFAVFLFFVFSVSVDNKLEQRALQNANLDELRATQNQPSF